MVIFPSNVGAVKTLLAGNICKNHETPKQSHRHSKALAAVA
jgi:hypothetical protein